MTHSPIFPAELEWRDNQPSSVPFGDVYFSRQDGLAESRHVFLNGNGLPERWQGCSQFTIAETGFGTGLNFLATWAAWRAHAPMNARLHYISTEQYPLSCEQLARAHGVWPELAKLSHALTKHMPPLLPGFHRLYLDKGRAQLTLLYGDAEKLLPELQAQCDAWYLDGFNPRQNEGLWNNSLYREIARLTAAHGTFATYSAAGHVRRGLQQAGFTVTRQTGFGQKREMLAGYKEGKPATAMRPAPLKASENIVIIGAGLAGVCIAHALTRRGHAVTLIDKEGLAQGASGNPGAVFMPYFTKDWGERGRFYSNAYSFTLAQLEQLAERYEEVYTPCGVVERATERETRQRQGKYASLGLPSDVFHWQDDENMAHYPRAGWVDMTAWCKALLHEMGDACQLVQHDIADIRPIEKGWELLDCRGNVFKACQRLIVATSHAARQLSPLALLPLAPVRGQVTLAESEARAQYPLLKYEGYALSPQKGEYIIGSTYQQGSAALPAEEEDDDANLAALQQAWPEISSMRITGNWVGIRSTSRQRMPLIGETHLPRLYVSLAHASRGSLSCPYGGEILASQLCGEPVPLDSKALAALSPARYEQC